MSAATINSFPSFHSLNSPRGWALAIIALVHLGFFWALSNGLSHSILKVFIPAPPVLIPEPTETVKPPPKPIDDVTVQSIPLPTPPLPYVPIDESQGAPLIVAPQPDPTNTFTDHGDVSPPQPVIVEPRIDARRGLSEPYYPPAVIRIGGEGTVLLSLYILPDGRVGDIKLDQSSGHPKLDESAMREAKKWRFVPGSRDGAPAAMWKQVPITFRLNNN
jgi:periplasmic protein TonB